MANELTKRVRSRASSSCRQSLLLHPLHAVVLVVLLLFAIAWSPLWLAGVIALELLVLVGAPKCRSVQRWAEREREVKQLAAATAARAALVQQMSDAHRCALTKLEDAASQLRRCASDPKGSLVIDDLLGVFVKLSIAHRTATEVLRTSAPEPEQELAWLERRSAEASPPSGPTYARRLLVLRRRCEARKVARDELTAIELDLATIADTIHWTNERSANAGCAAVHGDLTALLEGFAEASEALAEVEYLEDRSEVVDVLPKPSDELWSLSSRS